MKRKILLVFLSALIMVMFLPTSALAVNYYGDYSYVPIGNGNCRITGYYGGSTANIPSTFTYTFNTYTVTEIGESAFYNKGLTSVTLPDTIEVIGYAAFRENSLNSIALPDDLITIGRSAFNRNSLTSVTIGDNVESIGEYAFYNNDIDTLILGDSVETIGEYAFTYNNITNIELPNTLTFIDSNAFYGNFNHDDFLLPTHVGYENENMWVNGNGVYFDAGSLVSDTKTSYKIASAGKFFTVSLSQQGGTGTDTLSCQYSVAMPTADVPTKEGYTFNGYFSKENGGGTKYYNSDMTSAKNWDITNDTTYLFARWIAEKYTVTFDSQGGSSVNSQSVKYSNLASEPTEPTLTGYTFAGWYTDSSYSIGSAWNFDSCIVTEAIELYAKWTTPSVTDIEFTNTYTAINLSISDAVENICPYTITSANALDTSVTWQSSNNVVADITNGFITANAEGKTIITVTASDTTNGTISTQMLLEVIDSTSIGTDSAGRSISGVVVDSSGAELNGFTVTTYSSPLITLTEGLGNFAFNSIPFTNHTLVVSDAYGYELGRFTLNFSKVNYQKINVDNVNNIADVNYFSGTESIDLTIQANSSFTDIDIIGYDIQGSNIAINPQTSDKTNNLLLYMIGGMILLAAAGYFVIKKSIVVDE